MTQPHLLCPYCSKYTILLKSSTGDETQVSSILKSVKRHQIGCSKTGELGSRGSKLKVERKCLPPPFCDAKLRAGKQLEKDQQQASQRYRRKVIFLKSSRANGISSSRGAQVCLNLQYMISCCIHTKNGMQVKQAETLGQLDLEDRTQCIGLIQSTEYNKKQCDRRQVTGSQFCFAHSSNIAACRPGFTPINKWTAIEEGRLGKAFIEHRPLGDIYATKQAFRQGDIITFVSGKASSLMLVSPKR